MGNATLAKQRAIGLIGQARTDKLYEDGPLVVLYAADYARLKERLAELERENRLLRDIAADQAELSGIAAQVLREVGTR